MNQPEIKVTPLIDVLLVLLIIFMVITPTRSSSVETAIPSEPTNIDNTPPHPDTLVLKVNGDDSLSLNHIDGLGTVEEPEKAIEYIRDIFRGRTENSALNEKGEITRTVFVKAPRSANYGSVAKVVDAAKIAGAGPVSLQIDMLDE